MSLTRAEFQKNLDAIMARIEAACLQAGREKKAARLLAVSKTQSIDAIRTAYSCGVRDFGENYVQELVDKQRQLASLTDIRWHLIGHLQRNKAKLVRGCFAIHSLDSLELAQKLEQTLATIPSSLQKINVYVQLQVDPQDENKFGLATDEEALKLCGFLQTSRNLTWVGFMGMGPADTSSEKLLLLYRNFVARGQRLWKACKQDGEPQFSLGMSNDLEQAIASGSQLVRVGTALFGTRS